MSCIIKDGKYYDNNGNESKLYQDLVEKVGEQEAHNLFVLSHTPTFKSQLSSKSSEAEDFEFLADLFGGIDKLVQEKGISNIRRTEIDDLISDITYKDDAPISTGRIVRGKGVVTFEKRFPYKAKIYLKQDKNQKSILKEDDLLFEEYYETKNQAEKAVEDEKKRIISERGQNYIFKIDDRLSTDESILGEAVLSPFSLPYKEQEIINEGNLFDILYKIPKFLSKYKPKIASYDVKFKSYIVDENTTIDEIKDKIVVIDDTKEAVIFNLPADEEIIDEQGQKITIQYSSLAGSIISNIFQKITGKDVNLDYITYLQLIDKQEPSATEVLKYAEDNFSLAEPLTQEEVLDLSTLQIDNVETSQELYDLLYDTFYVDNLFSPQKNLKKLKKIYTETEIRNILQDISIQARIKETVEKLRFTEPFNITQIDKTNPYYYKELIINTIGQYKSSISEPKEGVEIDVIDESNNPVENKLFYTNAIKEVKNPKIFQAIDAIIAAPKNLTEEIKKVQKKVEGWLLDHGMNIKNLPIENYPTLKNYLREVKEEDAIELEKALGFERSPKKETVKIDTPTNRTYKHLRTTKTEQELFDQYSLIKTNTPNVYHQIEKIEEQEIRDIQENQDLTVPVYELYKDYYGYREGLNEGLTEGLNEDININEDYVADFAIEKLKKPNEFNELFKITENGIELINDDILTIAKVKSQINNYPKMRDYAKISKILSTYDLVPAEKTIETKENRRIQAVNNKQSIPSPKTEIEIIDEQFIKAPNETVEFLKIGNNIFEQQQSGIYSKLEFTENPNYFTLKVEAPLYRTFDQTIEKPIETKVKKLIDKNTNDENFSCL